MGHRFKPEEPLHETVAVLSYEVGSLLEATMYQYWNSDTSALAKEDFKTRLMDVAAQLNLVCESAGVSISEMEALGLEKARMRFNRKDWKYQKLPRKEIDGD